jgi:Trk K+ transport system NAD-binding subunit
MLLMGIFGYSKNTGFMAGLTVAQISEFSLILIALGVRVGHISSEILSFVTIIGLITIAGSTYMIMYSEKIYPYLSKYLSVFERKNKKQEKDVEQEYEYVLFGENRIGFSIMKSFIHSKKKYIIIDFNPERVRRLKCQGVKCFYGDVSNLDFIDNLKIEKAKMIVSTIPEKEINFMILKKIRQKNKESIVIVTARQIGEAFELYNSGADYVILPHFLGGQHTSELIERIQTDKKEYAKEKAKQIKELKERLAEGQKHPEIERD